MIIELPGAVVSKLQSIKIYDEISAPVAAGATIEYDPGIEVSYSSHCIIVSAPYTFTVQWQFRSIKGNNTPILYETSLAGNSKWTLNLQGALGSVRMILKNTSGAAMNFTVVYYALAT